MQRWKCTVTCGRLHLAPELCEVKQKPQAQLAAAAKSCCGTSGRSRLAMRNSAKALCLVTRNRKRDDTPSGKVSTSSTPSSTRAAPGSGILSSRQLASSASFLGVWVANITASSSPNSVQATRRDWGAKARQCRREAVLWSGLCACPPYYFLVHVAQKCHRSGGTQAFPVAAAGTGCLRGFPELDEAVQLPRTLIHDEAGSCRCASSIVTLIRPNFENVAKLGKCSLDFIDVDNSPKVQGALGLQCRHLTP